MKRRNSLFAALLIVAWAGCSSTVVEEPNESQSQLFEQLEALDANVTVTLEGEITEVQFETDTLGDDEVALLKEIPTLTRVSFSGSSVSDDGLSHLHEISTLEYVGLQDTRVSGAAVQSLREALPNCNIDYGGE